MRCVRRWIAGIGAVLIRREIVKRFVFAVIAAATAVPAFADVSASIGVSQPGFYGQINIGDFPRPAVIYSQPVWIARPANVVFVEPIYLRVPPGHEKQWQKRCGEYGACGRPVYFVREDWYQTKYVPYYRDRQGGGGKPDHGGKNKHGHD
jgi:hypothetical protein